jgi:Cytochrome c7 and related cytochrome c
MAQIFHRSTNTFSRVTIFGAVFIVAAILAALFLIARSSYATGVGTVVNQPIPFSHKHHVGDDGIDCRYCHTSVETSAFAGMPPSQTCMNCHSQIWSQSPELAAVRDSFTNKTPIAWNRVYVLPDFVYFDHSIHVNKGIGCETCHGRVDQMPLMYKAQSLQMTWCIDCHRDPVPYLRPQSAIFTMGYQYPANQEQVGQQLMKQYGIQIRTDCVTCHR